MCDTVCRFRVARFGTEHLTLLAPGGSAQQHARQRWFQARAMGDAPAPEEALPTNDDPTLAAAAAEAAAAKRLAEAAEQAAVEAEAEMAKAAALAAEAAQLKVAADVDLESELEKLRMGVGMPEPVGYAGGATEKAQVAADLKALRSGEAPSGPPQLALGGAAERNARDAEMAAIPKRSIKDIKKKDKELAAKAKDTKTGGGGSKSKGKLEGNSSLAYTPTVPHDSWQLQQLKKTPQKDKARNRFNLMSAPDSKASAKVAPNNVGCQNIDAWTTQAFIEAKKNTLGAWHREHIGVKGTVNTADLQMAHALKVQKDCATSVLDGRGPQVGKLVPCSEYMGIKPKMDVHDYMIETTKMQQEVGCQAVP